MALAADQTILATEKLDQRRRRASDLTSIARELLLNAGWTPKELSAVVVGLGPGSFTALRVGLASAKTLAYATGCAFIGVETFAAYAWQITGPKIAVIGDALQGELYVREYVKGKDDLVPSSPMKIISREDWETSLEEDFQITGPGTNLLTQRQNQVVESSLQILLLNSLLNVAKNCPWAVHTNMWTAEPIYLRGSSAEEKTKKSLAS